VALGEVCDFLGKCVGAVVASKQRDDGGAVFGNGDDWWLSSLVIEMRSNGADKDAAGAEADDGLALQEELGEMGCGLGVGDIAAFDAIGRAALSFWASGSAETPRMKMTGFTMTRCPYRPEWW
jgi:hypothetical protein